MLSILLKLAQHSNPVFLLPGALLYFNHVRLTIASLAFNPNT